MLAFYASIKARNEQSFQCKRYEDEALRAKLMELESVIQIRDEENDNLQVDMRMLLGHVDYYLHTESIEIGD